MKYIAKKCLLIGLLSSVLVLLITNGENYLAITSRYRFKYFLKTGSVDGVNKGAKVHSRSHVARGHSSNGEKSQINEAFSMKVLHDGKTTAAASVDSWLERQAVRKQLLKDECNKNLSLKMNLTDVIHNDKGLLWPYLVDDKYRILYGFVPKVGSTNWKSIFLVLNGTFKSVEEIPGWRAHDKSLKNLRLYAPDEIEYRLRNYTTFVFVRDPLVRLISACRSKLQGGNEYYQRTIGRRIIRKYRENPTKMELEAGVNVTFAEFVRFITDKEVKRKMDYHWKPIYQMVLPCNIHFDFIGKMETAKEDAENILRHLKIDHLVHFKKTRKKTSDTDEIFNKYYKTISQEYLDELYEIYAPDFRIFGYSMDRNLTRRKSSLQN